MKRLTLTTLLFVACGIALAGMPLYSVIKLRSIEVQSCEKITPENAASVSRAVNYPEDPEKTKRAATIVAESIPGFVIGAIVMRHRTIRFSMMNRSDTPDDDTGWQDGGDAVDYFYPSKDTDACREFASGAVVLIGIDPKAECDTAPPVGTCRFDAPIWILNQETRNRWGDHGPRSIAGDVQNQSQ